MEMGLRNAPLFGPISLIISQFFKQSRASNMKKTIFLIAISLMLASCFGRKPFQPPPKEYEAWKKAGATELETKKMLLECGYPDPLNSGGYAWPINDMILSDLCLQTNGFVFNSDRNWRSYMCPKNSKTNPPACQPNAVIPTPSIERRLNSPYCKKYPKSAPCAAP